MIHVREMFVTRALLHHYSKKKNEKHFASVTAKMHFVVVLLVNTMIANSDSMDHHFDQRRHTRLLNVLLMMK